jgi:hypothetical protein
MWRKPQPSWRWKQSRICSTSLRLRPRSRLFRFETDWQTRPDRVGKAFHNARGWHVRIAFEASDDRLCRFPWAWRPVPVISASPRALINAAARVNSSCSASSSAANSGSLNQLFDRNVFGAFDASLFSAPTRSHDAVFFLYLPQETDDNVLGQNFQSRLTSSFRNHFIKRINSFLQSFTSVCAPSLIPTVSSKTRSRRHAHVRKA